MPDTPQAAEAVKVFYSYSHKDEELRNSLETHLALLKRRGVISGWHDRRIGAGDEWAGQIDEHMKTADIILLLVSADFLASDYCYDKELTLALRQHEAKKARVIPVILRPCDLTDAPFGKLQSLPKDRLPVTKWPDRDEAFTDIANGIRLVVEELKVTRSAAAAPEATATENISAAVTPKAAATLIPRPPFIGFVARRDEHGRDIVGLLKDELSPDKSQLIAIWGVGGTGKTTLAAEVARSLRDDFPQRLAWVSALGRVDFGLQTLLDDIATQLGREDLRRSAPDPKTEQVRALLAASPSFVVLDNFETIEPGEQTRCVGFLAERTECSALITTRERVNHADVRNIRLAAMAMDDAREFWRRMVEQSVRPSAFAGLDADDIIRHCEANPLVIQWVVGQIELAQRPRDVLDYLSQGQGDAAERVFDRSFNLPQLGDDGRAALLALSLFTPDASREALAEVAGFGDDLNRLNNAVRKMSALWLVETTEGHERLFLRALKHEMAKSRLSKDAHANVFRRRYVEHFLRYAQAHAEPTPENLDALEAEKDNLRGAMDAAFGLGDFDSVILLGDGLSNFLRLRGYWDEAIRSNEQAEEAARRSNDDGSATAFMTHVAQIRTEQGEYKEAEAVYRKALKIFKSLGSEVNVAIMLHQLGSIALEREGLEEARMHFDESLEISKRLNDPIIIAATTSQLGVLLYRQGDVEQSKARHEESLAIRLDLVHYEGIATDLIHLGNVALAQKEWAEARRLYNESLRFSMQMGYQRNIAIASRNLGLVAEREGDNEEAARLYREALRIYELVGSPEANRAREDLARVEGEIH